jgi:hypothetical protein
MSSPSSSSRAARAHARQPSIVDVNNNTSWMGAPGVWFSYIALLLLVWLALCALLQPGTAWDVLQLAHFGVTFPLFHWHKGSPIAADQGAYDKLTFWEQMDGGVQLTSNKKFFTVVPVALFLLGWQHGDHTTPMGVATLAAAFVLLVAKFPFMYKVRLFGINKD